MSIEQRQRDLAILRAMGASLPERGFTAPILSQWTRLTLPETKGSLRRLVRDGLVRKRTDPDKPTSNLYFRVGA